MELIPFGKKAYIPQGSQQKQLLLPVQYKERLPYCRFVIYGCRRSCAPFWSLISRSGLLKPFSNQAL